MQSSYVHTKPQAIEPQLAGLAGINADKNIISTSYYQVRIIGRNPANGPPQKNTGLTLQVEIETSRGDDFFDVLNPDAPVVVRQVSTNKILGYKYIATEMDWLSGATGKGSILLNSKYNPETDGRIKIELYDDDDVQSLADVANATPVAVSQPVNIALGINAGRKAGIYDAPYEYWYEGVDGVNILGDAKNILKYATILTAAGAGVYFLAPFAPAIKSGLSSFAGKFKDDK